MFSLQGRLRYETGLYLVIVAAIVLVSASLLAAVTSQINNASEANADQLFGREAARVEAELGLLFSTPIKGAAILADQPAASAAIAGDGLNHPAFPIIAATLRQDPNLYSGYIGRADGSFLQIIPTHGDPRVIGALHAPSGTGLIVRAISAESGGARVERWTYFGGGGARLGQDTHADPAYDPRTRPWYLESMARAGPDVGQPYLFSSIAALGVTASQRLPDASGVVGFDLTLTQLNRLVGAQRVSPRSAVILTTRNDRFIGDSHVAWLGDDDPAPLADLRQDRHLISALLALPEVTPPANRLVDAADLPAAGADRVTWPLIVRTARLFAGREGEMRVAIAAPFADFNESLHALRNRILIFAGVLLLVSLPASHFGARRLSRPLKLLTAQVRRIQDWDFSGATPPRSAICEFAALSDAFESMKETLLERTQSSRTRPGSADPPDRDRHRAGRRARQQCADAAHPVGSKVADTGRRRHPLYSRQRPAVELPLHAQRHAGHRTGPGRNSVGPTGRPHARRGGPAQPSQRGQPCGPPAGFRQYRGCLRHGTVRFLGHP